MTNKKPLSKVETYDIIIGDESSDIPIEKRTVVLEFGNGTVYMIGDPLTVMMAQYDNARMLFRDDNIYINIDWLIEYYRERKKKKHTLGLMKIKSDVHKLWMKKKEE